MERMDPVLHTDPPGSGQLPTGTAVRLDARTGTRCVGEGSVADFPGNTWGSTSLAVGKRRTTDRVAVRLGAVVVPGELALHCNQHGDKEESLEALGVGALVLWDTVSQTAGSSTPHNVFDDKIFH